MNDDIAFSGVFPEGESAEAEETRRFQANLAALQAGTLTKDHGQLYNTIVEIGHRHMVEANKAVEPFLTSDDPELRRAALMVLALDLELVEYAETALHFLRDDPDPNCRAQGAVSTGALLQGSHNQQALTALARAASNEQENNFVRSGAYAGLLGVLGRPTREIFIARQQFPKNADWELVASFFDKR